MSHPVDIPFDNQYCQLAERLFSRRAPTAVEQPGLICLNEELAEVLGLNCEQLRSEQGLAVLAGNALAEGSDPIATVYAGHQFGGWNPQLGDGRAILLGEVVGRDGLHYDLQLKGAGVTPYSRMGDGRSPLGPVLREYIVSEAMARMGVPTTRALAAVTTGETVVRDELLPGAILTRVARSHIRVGTFQYFAAREDWDAVRQLADFAIARHYPEAQEAHYPYLALLSQVIERQAELIAHWQSLGFIHGVMNTDNMLIGGETVDYGPCAFMESYHPGTVFSSIDHNGRYAYSNQPSIAHWNLAWLAQSLLGIIHDDQETAIKWVQDALDEFSDIYMGAYQRHMAAKIGFNTASDSSNELVLEYLSLLAKHQLDFTLGFRVLEDLVESDTPPADSPASLYPLPEACKPWLSTWREALAVHKTDPMHETVIENTLHDCNPVFIPRNHLVEQVIAAGNQGDFAPFQHLLAVLKTPYRFDSRHADYAMPARPEQQVTRTFCGT